MGLLNSKKKKSTKLEITVMTRSELRRGCVYLLGWGWTGWRTKGNHLGPFLSLGSFLQGHISVGMWDRQSLPYLNTLLFLPWRTESRHSSVRRNYPSPFLKSCSSLCCDKVPPKVALKEKYTSHLFTLPLSLSWMINACLWFFAGQWFQTALQESCHLETSRYFDPVDSFIYGFWKGSVLVLFVVWRRHLPRPTSSVWTG